MRFTVVLFSLFFFGSANAAVVTLDFADVPPEAATVTESNGQQISDVDYAGFLFRRVQEAPAAPGSVPDFLNQFSSGSLVAAPGEGAGFSMSAATDEFGNYTDSFSLFGFEAAYFPDKYNMTVTGYVWDSDAEALYALTPEVFFVDSGFAEFSIANGGLHDLAMVTFESDLSPVIVTAVSVSGVPVPAAVWLFGSALVGLGWLRRRT